MVELIAVIAVIAVLCIILRVSLDAVMISICVIVTAFIAAIMLFFGYFLFRLITSENVEAVFSKIDTSPKSKFKTAYYTVNNAEYPNAFPAEKSSRLYQSNKPLKVFLNRKINAVFDKFSIITIVLGSVFSFTTMGAVVYLFISNM